MGERKGGKPSSGETPFESMTHAELTALLSSASKETAMMLAGKLTAAAATINDIGEDLKARVRIVRWDGQAGDNFREWGDQTANATLLLGSYAENAATWMTQVTQAITEAHANMPLTSDTESAQASLRTAEKNLAAATDPRSRNDPDARTAAQTSRSDAASAQASLDATHAEAVRQMRKLAETYVQSGEQINLVTPPTFPPPAGYLGEGWVQPEGYKSLPGQTYGGGTSSDTSSSAAYARGATADGSGGSDFAAPGGVGRVGADRPVGATPVGMEIDSVAALPDVSVAPSVTPPANQPVTRPDGPISPIPGAIPPAFSGGSGLPGTTGPGRMAHGVRGPVLPGQGGLNPRMPMARESGIVGGRPVPPSSGRPTGGIPRGTVVGGEGTQGRGPMGRGAGPGMGGIGAGGAGQSGLAGGRRLASESGGVVGGRPQQPGKSSARPFTPGGSGLVRGGANSGTGSQAGPLGRGGAVPPGGRGTKPPGDDRDGERPDYLTEDEETWQQGSRRIVPPVID
ncbi:coiled-coil domain-containing protein [Streptomyces sp. NPDC058220]|uniref:coiled-coil domain-containing protein n=1 Tax=Streptomyces sp. NPDC058220 TaxID=3346387 RepID=UPI0036E89D07